MSRQSRVEVIGQGEFDAREWLRRDVLWASLMSPYSRQIAGWLDGSAIQQHNGNVSRQQLYASMKTDAEAQSMAFFNQGKNVAGLISSVALFRILMVGGNEGSVVNLIDVQANSVDKVLGRIATKTATTQTSEAVAYANCAEIVKSSQINPNQFGNKHRLLRASNIMAELATSEARLWIEASYQDEESLLPHLIINNGGHPRSAGPRVEMLTPNFHKILQSEEYLALVQ